VTTTGKVIWQAGNAALGHWTAATTYQCGMPVQNGASFSFNLKRNGTQCGRNQAFPVDSSGSAIRLTDGAQYTWTFDYVDGTPSGAGPGMGYDRDARSLIFQVHPYAGGNPCASLNFFNGATIGGTQQWELMNCSGTVWRGSYTPGEHDSWKISMIISQTSAGHIWLYRNGVKVADVPGATYNNSGGGQGGPWFNFGPYKWQWESSSTASSTTQVNATINNMTLTQQ
jgi:hypothetical protein